MNHLQEGDKAAYVLQSGTFGSLNIYQSPITEEVKDNYWVDLLVRKNSNTNKTACIDRPTGATKYSKVCELWYFEEISEFHPLQTNETTKVRKLEGL